MHCHCYARTFLKSWLWGLSQREFMRTAMHCSSFPLKKIWNNFFGHPVDLFFLLRSLAEINNWNILLQQLWPEFHECLILVKGAIGMICRLQLFAHEMNRISWKIQKFPRAGFEPATYGCLTITTTVHRSTNWAIEGCVPLQATSPDQMPTWALLEWPWVLEG